MHYHGVGPADKRDTLVTLASRESNIFPIYKKKIYQSVWPVSKIKVIVVGDGRRRTIIVYIKKEPFHNFTATMFARWPRINILNHLLGFETILTNCSIFELYRPIIDSTAGYQKVEVFQFPINPIMWSQRLPTYSYINIKN